MNENSAARGGLLDSTNPPAGRMDTQSGVATCVLPEARIQPMPKLAKVETVALWYAVNWMEHILHSWRCEGFKDERDQAQYQAEKERLRIAKQALRKVNKIRKEQGK